MVSKIKRHIIRHLSNLPGWRTDRKIVVLESDDWGSIRMASKDVYNRFLNKGYRVDQCPYNRNDTIESNLDLELLFEVLNSVQDRNGNAAVLTANNIVANPDFDKIRASDYSNYYYEPFNETLKRYPGRDRVMELYRQGIDEKIFRPQFHGREHLNVNRWMQELNNGDKILHDAFEQNMFTVHKAGATSGRGEYLDAFGEGYDKEWVSMNEVIETGLDLFESFWGYRATSFIAPCYVWPVQVEKILAEYGFDYIQGTYVQRIPQQDNELSIKKKYHYTGQQNRWGQRFFIRNVHFEPVENEKKDSVAKAFEEVKLAFRYHKPAVISTHRVNYMGGIRPENRDNNLKLLKRLLQQIVNKYPDVEFMSSDQLGNLVTKEN